MFSLEEISQRIRTQDNRCTAHPIVLVEREEHIYGIDFDYDPEIAWLHEDECVRVWDETLCASLEAQYQDTGDIPEGYRRVGYKKRWTYVSSFFTVAAAELFITNNTHRYSDRLRVYIDSAYRNPEWIEVRSHLIRDFETPAEKAA